MGTSLNLMGKGQGPHSNIKYYPDANNRKGGYMLDTGAGRPGTVRLKPQYDLPPRADRGITKASKKHYG